jgi:ring-1,2-phenylacetyl-CoA epoxidase subunit PaaC
VARQLFVDVFNTYYLADLAKSKDENLAAIASKSMKETRYHLRRSRDWVLRLGDGTDESHKRMVAAINDLWGYTHELFEHDELERRLIDAGIAVDASTFKDAWLTDVKNILEEATLSLPDAEWAVRGGRQGYHTENLGHLLTEMQFVHRAYPNCEW